VPALSQPPMRKFGDYKTIRNAVFDNALESVKGLKPVENSRYSLAITEPHYPSPADYTTEDHTKAMIEGRSLSRRMMGTYTLKDKATGNVVDHKTTTIASVPVLTQQGTFIMDGTAMPVSSQLRLLPGVYSRRRQNNTLESHVNLTGRGVSHRIHLDPQTGVFKMTVGQAEIPVVNLLRAFGTTDDEIKSAWGNDLFNVNRKHDKPHYLDRLYEKFGPAGKRPDGVDLAKVVAERISNYDMDPWVSQRTLGKPLDKYGKDAVLSATSRLLKIAHGETEPDDRDSLAYATVWGPEHLIAERLTRVNPILSKMMWQVTNTGNLKRLPAGLLTQAIRTVFTKSGLAQCFDSETKVLTARGFVSWPEVTPEDSFACLIEGKVEFHNGKLREYDYEGEMYGCKTKKFSYLVTPDHRLYTAPSASAKRDVFRFEFAKDAHNLERRFISTIGERSATQITTRVGDLIQIPTSPNYKYDVEQAEISVKAEVWAEFLGWFLSEGCVMTAKRRYQYQKITTSPVRSTEGTQLITAIAQSPKANPENFAQLNRLLARMPFRWHFLKGCNQFKCTHRRLGEFLEGCGKYARNKRIPSYVFGWSDDLLDIFLDAFIAGDGNVSGPEACTKIELSSEGLIQDVAIVAGYLGYAPRIRSIPSRTKFSKKTGKTYNCRPTWSLSLGQNPYSMAMTSRQSLKVGSTPAYYTQTYCGKVYCATVPGGLLYVMRDGKGHWSGNSAEGTNAAEFMDNGARITKVGEGGIGRSADTIPDSARYVNPSQIPFIDIARMSECFDSETEVMTAEGWKKWSEVTDADRFACLIDDRLEFHHASKLHVSDYDGLMYGVKGENLNYLVTPNHRFWVQRLGCKPWQFLTAEQVHGCNVSHQSAGHKPLLGFGDSFAVPLIEANEADVAEDESENSSRRTMGDRRLKQSETYPIAPFAEFMGWYLGEGSTRVPNAAGTVSGYTTVITQSKSANPAKCERIEKTIAEVGLHGKYYDSAHGFLIRSRQLTEYVRQFGRSHERWIPEELLAAPVEARQRLFDALLLAEGTRNAVRYTKFSSTSKRMAQDFCRLAFSLGYSTTVATYKDRRKDSYHLMYLVTLHTRTVRQVRKDYTHKKSDKTGDYYTQAYKGKVYCATVPGGKLYVRRQEACGFWSGNSETIGVDLRTAFGTRLGHDKQIYAPVKDMTTNKLVYKSPRDLADSTVGFPDALHSTDAVVPVIKGGKLTYAPKKEINYLIPSMEQTFSPLTNMVPLKSSSKAHRSSMGAKMLVQSLELSNAEAPLVRTEVPGQPGKSFEELYGKHTGAVFSRPNAVGQVKEVTPFAVKIGYPDGTEDNHQIYHYLPSGRKSATHQTPLVKVGDMVNPNQLIVKSNSVDKNGHLAYGANARVAFMTAPGVYEDSLAISKSFAKRLTSEHLYRHQLENDDATRSGKSGYVAAFPGRHSLDVLKTIGDDGIVQPGTVVKKGDPLILAIKNKQSQYGRLSRSGRSNVGDASETWDYDEPGTVVGVHQTKNGPVVLVNAQKAAKEGDKLCYDPQTEIFTGKGWKSVSDLTPTDLVLSRKEDGTIEYLYPTAIHSYAHTGKMFHLEHQEISLCVTPNHHLYVKRDDAYTYELIEAQDLKGGYTLLSTIRTNDAPAIVEIHVDEETHQKAWVDYDGHVYCATLPRNNVMYARRGNNIAVWCGNSGRHGNKGVTVIKPDEEMPHDAQGRPIDIIISSLGTVSRANPSAIFEAFLGKIAEKRGQPYVVPDFQHGQDNAKFVQKEGEKHGVSFMEDLTDPQTGRKIPQVGVGNMYIMKLTHMSEGKVKGRGLGGYDETGQPLRGKAGAAMRSSLGDTNALLSSGATNVIHDAHAFRGQSNPEFWLSYMSGYPAPRPNVSKPFERFLTELRAGGIDPVRKDSRYHLMALTDTKINELAGDRVVENGETLDFSRNGEPYKKGLFDVGTFGSVDNATQWAKVPLHEPVLNPVFDEPARRLLGLTEQKFRDTIAGKHKIATGTGMSAIVDALKQMDVSTELAKVRKLSQSARKTQRDEANRTIGYLKTMEANKTSPKDWVISSVPVMPPAFRPVSQGANGLIVNDQNLVYKDLLDANSVLKDLSKEVSDVGQERLNLYDAVKATFGLGAPVNAKHQEKQVKGVLERLLGSTAKYSYAQQKLLGTPIDLSGRGQVLPSPDLNLDEIGIPEKMGWQVFHPFVVRQLVRNGMPRVEAARHVADQTPVARQALLKEMEQRPVLATRYPALHRYNVQAFFPRLVKGDALLTNNLINRSFNLDHDGDQQLGSVLVLIPDMKLDSIRERTATTELYWETRRVPFSKTALPIHTQNGISTYLVNLADFPHESHLGSKVGEKGLIDFYAVPSDVKVISYDESTSNVVMATVESWSVHHDREVEIVNLRSGRQIFTDDDPRGVYGIDPETYSFKRARPADGVGMYVPIASRLELLNEDDRTVSQFSLPDDERLNKSIMADRDIGYFFGTMVGNGWVTEGEDRYRRLYLACSDDNVGDEFRKILLEKVFCDPPTIGRYKMTSEYGVGWRYDVASPKLAEFVEPLIGIGARNKHLPPFFASCGRAFAKGLLEGLIDTDGTVSTNEDGDRTTVSYSTTSVRLAQEVQHLCRLLGVYATVSPTKTPAGLSNYIVNIVTRDFAALKCKLLHKFKSSNLARTQIIQKAGPRYAATTWVPYPKRHGHVVRKIVKAHGDAFYERFRRAGQSGLLTRDVAREVIAVVGDRVTADDWELFKQLAANDNVSWDVVENYVKTGILETGYDLTVPGFETFMSVDGVILSNTMTVSVPLSEEAVKEAYEKLLPSKNLYSPASFKATNFVPNMEYIQGLHAVSNADEKNPHVTFRTKKEAFAAYKRGEINAGTRVRIVED